MVILSYIIHRAGKQWQLFLNLTLGVVFATSLLAGAPLLVDTVLDLGLRHRFIAAALEDKNLRFRTHVAAAPSVVGKIDTDLNANLQRWLGSYEAQVVFSASSPPTIPWVDGAPLTGDRVNIIYMEGLEDHVDLVEGDWPTTPGASINTVPVVVSEVMAQAYRVGLGDVLPLGELQNSDQPSWLLSIAAIARPTDPDDPWWDTVTNPLVARHGSQETVHYSVILPEASFYQVVTDSFPDARIQLIWEVQLAPERITIANLPNLQRRIDTIQWDLNHDQDQIGLTSGLDDLLAEFSREAWAVRTPLYILTADIVLVVLYYVIMMAALSVQQTEREYAVLRSRGASTRQILAIQGIEAGLIVLVACLSGLTLARGLIHALITWGPLSRVAMSGWPLRVTWVSWLAVAMGGVVCMIGLMVPIAFSLQRSIVSHQLTLSRPPRIPWWQRAYLDMILLLVSLALLWRFYLYGGAITDTSPQTRVDWLLLLSPLLLLIGSATILLRVLPLLLRLVARLAARGKRLVAPLALWYAARNPTQVVLLVLLLTLATALGMLSSGLNTALDESEWVRARYAVGGDLQILTSDPVDLTAVRNIPGVYEVSWVARDVGTVEMWSDFIFPQFEVLAIEPSAVARLASFRDDFSDEPMADLLMRLIDPEADSTAGQSIPEKAVRIGLWAWSPLDVDRADYRHSSGFYEGSSDLDRLAISIKLRSSQGNYISVALEPINADECPFACCSNCCPGLAAGDSGSSMCRWQVLAGGLPVPAQYHIPWFIHSVWFQNAAQSAGLGFLSTAVMEIGIDNIIVIDTQGSVAVMEDFEQPSLDWHTTKPGSWALEETGTEPFSGLLSPYLELHMERPSEYIGFYPAGTNHEEILPVLASPDFMNTTRLTIGDTVSVWVHSATVSACVVGVADYFPTMYENYGTGSDNTVAGYLIMPRDELLSRINARVQGPVTAGELWLTTNHTVSTDQILASIPRFDEARDVETIHGMMQVDPMSLGIRSVTFAGYILTSVLSIVGVVTHFYMSALRRSFAYSLLRTMGLSRWQLYASLIIEQMMLAAAGLVLGAVLGVLLNQVILPNLPITLGAIPPVPPFQPRVDWTAIGRIFLVLGGALTITLGLATILLWHNRTDRVLRIGEE